MRTKNLEEAMHLPTPITRILSSLLFSSLLFSSSGR